MYIVNIAVIHFHCHRLDNTTAHAQQLQIPVNKSRQFSNQKNIWIGGWRSEVLILLNLNISEIVRRIFIWLSNMSQLVSSGDSIKIWDTTSYDCIHDWSSSNNISGKSIFSTCCHLIFSNKIWKFQEMFLQITVPTVGAVTMAVWPPVWRARTRLSWPTPVRVVNILHKRFNYRLCQNPQ